MDRNDDELKPEGSVFSERTPENLEKYIELVEELQQEDPASGTEAREGAEERALNEIKSDPEISSAFVFGDEAHFLEDTKSEKLRRVRTANRIKYEAEVDVIRRQIGDLEDIRSKLGLSRRKMCQLLMVDPSAWTRWMKEGAPPYVYRALEWYMLLSKEAPHQAHSYWLATVGARGPDSDDKHLMNRLKHENLILEDKIRDMQSILAAMNKETEKMKQRNRTQTYATLFALLMGVGSMSLYVLSVLKH